MNINFYFLLLFPSLGVLYLLYQHTRFQLFDKYFQIYAEETYNLDDLFQIKIQGSIIPKVDFLDIPYETLHAEINTSTIRGSIHRNEITLELVRPKDRSKALALIKHHYIKVTRPHIVETVRNKKEYIRLIQISKGQRKKMEKIACHTCKHRVQCQIAFTQCNYERESIDRILQKGIKVELNTTPTIKNSGKP